MSNKQNWGEDAASAPPGRNPSLYIWSALAIAAGLVFVYVLFYPPQSNTRDGINHPGVGQPLPDLRLSPLTGTEQGVRLSDLKGKVVLVNFWGTWCPPCRMEFPELLALRERLSAESDFRLLSVSCGGSVAGEEEDALRETTGAFLRAAKADLPTYADPGEFSRETLIRAARLEDFGYPTTVLLDRQGTIRGVWQGYRENIEHDIDAAIRATLAK